MNQYRCETFETVGGIKKASKYRCETCGFNKPIGEDGRYCSKASEISVIFMPDDDSNMYLGCDSHSDFQSERENVFPSSSDLLLIAHDEWKRREERRHIHQEIPWVHGWISGFLTPRDFVKKRIAELRKNSVGGDA